MKKIGKLVRDNIPEIIKKDGKNPHTRVLSEAEFITELDKKFIEEQKEFLEEHDRTELADLLEIVHAYCNSIGITFDELETIRAEKANKNGGFINRIYLESVEE